ncbi:hypothetical protein JTB14_036273 [Gonioctena quinquepunctata]|nr:hypothetical protein JTB14_036273 [Gonioctena quinquepunctata]
MSIYRYITDSRLTHDLGIRFLHHSYLKFQKRKLKVICPLSDNPSPNIETHVKLNITHKHRQFIPFFRPFRSYLRGNDNGRLRLLDNENSTNASCPDSSSDDFPEILSEDQVTHGGIILVLLVGLYGFTLLAVVCDKYFLPCVETICETLKLSPDVAAATFMSIATSTPELFTNVIGTFVTNSDIGIGTIVGSSLFNGLGVAAIGSLAAPHPLQLDWWPISRDCTIYALSVIALVIITWDSDIFWYEATALMLIYCVYFTVMFQNKKIERFVRRKIAGNKVHPEIPEEYADKGRVSIISAYGTYLDDFNVPEKREEHIRTLEKIEQEDKLEAAKSLFRKPEGTWLQKTLFYYTWPIQLILKCTIPNPKLYPKYFPVTFFMCIVWIGVNSYVVTWMITIIGNLAHISDAVLGMTFVAAGSSLPESISMAIIARKGEGAFGVSNSLGANTMNILSSLGIPWFIKNLINGASKSHPVVIQSGSIEYTILSLIFVSMALFTTLACNRFRLSKITGLVLITLYVIVVVLAILSETVFFDNSNC